MERAQRRQNLANHEGEQIIARKLRQAMSQEINEQVDGLNANARPYTDLMVRMGFYPTAWESALVGGEARIGMTLPSFEELNASPGLTQATLREGEDFSIAAHDSVLAHVVGRALGGTTWTDVSFARLQKEITGTNSPEFFIGADPQRWSVRWDWQSPASTKYSPDGIEFQLNFTQMRLDKKLVAVPFQVSARYRPKVEENEAVLYRDRFSLHCQGREDLGDAMKFVSRKFNDLFAEKLFPDGLQMPAGDKLDESSKYSIVSITLDRHWLSTAYRKMRN